MEHFDSSQPGLPELSSQNLELQGALKAYHAAPSPQTREAMLEILKGCFVYVAVRELPEHLRAIGLHVSQEDTRLTTLASTNSQGEMMGLIFSDRAQVLARKPDAESIAMAVPLAARHGLDEGFEGLVIDPAGYWAELTRVETENLARGIAP